MKTGVGVATMGVMRPELVMKSIVPVVVARVLGGAKVKADEDVPQRVVGVLKVIGKKGMWSNACEFLKLMIGLSSQVLI
ncbi:hypothetical protein TB2_023907 [Malus domestica]